MGGDDRGRSDLPAELFGWLVRLVLVAIAVSIAFPIVAIAVGWLIENGPWMSR